MKVIESIKKQKVGFFLSLAALILTIIPLFYIGNVGKPMGSVPEQYPISLIMLIVGIVAQIAFLVLSVFEIKYAEYLKLVIVVLVAVGLSYFITGSILSIVDKVYNIVMWGDSTQFPAIVGFGTVLTAAEICNIVSCWFK